MRETPNAALADLTGEFVQLYPPRLGRPSIAPERLLGHSSVKSRGRLLKGEIAARFLAAAVARLTALAGPSGGSPWAPTELTT